MQPANSQDLAGQTAVVTGSTSGIGRAIALELAAAGADILIHGRTRRQAGEEIAHEIAGLGRKAEVVLCDLADAGQHEAFVEKTWAGREGVDIWINNAGCDVLTGEAASWPFEKKLERLWQVDVVATMRLSRLAGARMQKRGRGAILNIGWDQAEQGMAGDSGELFAAIKGAVMAFSRSLAQSLAPHVRVNCLAPGWIRTAWGERASAAWQERAQREALLARWGTPDDVARAARFLCSPAASFITGQVWAVNGGWKRA